MYIPYVLGFLNPLFTASIFVIFLDVRISSHFSPAGCWDPWTSWKENAFLYIAPKVFHWATDLKAIPPPH